MRQVLFQIHWFLGITAGLVLALMGVTGALMSFENEIQRALSPGIVTLRGTAAPALTPDTVIERAETQQGQRVTSLVVSSEPGRAWQVQFEAREKGKRGEHSFIDPRDGHLLGHANGEGFFRTVEDLHRWLALPGGPRGIGRQITGFSAIALVFFALSGLYLRWPKRALDWRAWFHLDLRMTGRNLYRALHAVIGGWVLLFYLLSALTGMWWSYDWYRQGVLHALTGKSTREEESRAGKEPGSPQPIDRAWQRFLTVEGQRFATVSISIPSGGEPVRFRALPIGARHDRMVDDLRIAPADGRIVKADYYASRSLGQVITTSMYELHRGAFFGIIGRVVMLITSLTMPLFTITGLLLYLARRRRKHAGREFASQTPVSAHDGSSDLLVAYASQTGGAELLARQTAAAFGSARVLPLASVDSAVLADVKRALFIVSTYGDGEAPDSARRFARAAMAAPPTADHIEYAVLARGDREYAEFCAFGHQLDHWLHTGGGRRLFDMVEMDGEDADARRHWQQQLAAIGGSADQPDWTPAAYQRWRLVERRLLNPGSAGGAAFLVALEPAEGMTLDWEAGDIVEIAPRHGPEAIAAFMAQSGLDSASMNGTLAEMLAGSILPDPSATADPTWIDRLHPLAHREYSIASVPADGRLELVVRQHVAPDGTLGLGSGWLTAHASLGAAIDLRVQANPGFRVPADAGAMILIGNGTGIAGLRAHLHHAERIGSKGHWLLFGERSKTHDALFAEELTAWSETGVLRRLDRAFSRDADCGRYVQDLVAEGEDEIREMVEHGATILVCGSLQGMAPAVDAALRRALGDSVLEVMAEQGRYRRDIY